MLIVSSVALRPKTTPRGSPATRSATASRDATTISSALPGGRRVGSAVRERAGQRGRDRVDDGPRRLRAAGRVEVRVAVGERGELRPDPLDVQSDPGVSRPGVPSPGCGRLVSGLTARSRSPETPGPP